MLNGWFKLGGEKIRIVVHLARTGFVTNRVGAPQR
jgi:hypothetical protein